MRPWISIVIAFFAVSALAQNENVIVEFRDAPLALASTNTMAKTSAIASYRATFARFRADVTSATSGAAEVRWEYFEVFNGAAVTVPRKALGTLAQLPYVKRVYRDREMQAMAGPAVAQIGADRFWSTYGSRGRGVVVAVIDTGIDYTHEALGKGFGPGFKVIGGYDFYNNDNDPMDDNFHGTHVSGIIAGESSTITGVAPDASLIAYKVLGANGSGSESTVMAAIERAADPNGDGDFSDHVDIVNMSLGGDGGPDSPSARAVNAATEAGVLFCIAAGNAGRPHAVSSPGTARSALTVAAVDSGDFVAVFSSRGPTPKDLTMKPEIGAPGVSIFSSIPGNRYLNASGTSMATPHVAGAAALIKALHHDWTPQQIKTALMINAQASTQDIMAIGAGRLDVMRASLGALSIDTPSINLGLDPFHQATWAVSRTIRATNRSDKALTFAVSTSQLLGAAVTVAPASVALAPGESADVVLSVEIDNGVIAVGTTLSNGGFITFSNPVSTMRVPWSFVKAVRSTLIWDKDFGVFTMIDAAHTAVSAPVPLDDSTAEVLLAGPATYDVLTVGYTYDPKAEGSYRPSLIYRDGVAFDGDMTVGITEASAGHLIRAAARGVDGNPLVATSEEQSYAIGVRLVYPDTTAKIHNLTTGAIFSHDLHVNDLGNKTLFITEMFADSAGHAFYALQHQPVTRFTGDVTLDTVTIRSAGVRLLFPPLTRHDGRMIATVGPINIDTAISAGTASPDVGFTGDVADQSTWNGNVYFTPDPDPAYSATVGFTVTGDGGTQYVTPMLRVTADAVTGNFAGAAAQPWQYNAGTFVFGGGPHFLTTTFSSSGVPLKPTVYYNMYGPFGESRSIEGGLTTTLVYSGTGTLIKTITSNPASLDLSGTGPYTIESVANGKLYPNLPVQTKLTMALDSSRADFVPPTVTSLFVVDGTGRALREIASHGSASLYFSAADYTNTPARTYHPVRTEATALWYRYAGSTTWTPLTVTQMVEDTGTADRLGGGVLYHADLTPVANVDAARIDLKIDLQDLSGNTTSMVMQPALLVGSEAQGRRRAVH